MSYASGRDIAWEERYRLLQEFIAKHGRFPKVRESYKGIKLGIWCGNQKRDMVSPTFNPERKKKLEALGLPEKMQRTTWEQFMEATLSFIQEHGRLPKESESHQGLKIGSWCFSQRYKANMPGYPPERRQKLEEAGIIGSPNMVYGEFRWEQQFQALKAFYEEYGRLPTETETYNGENVGTWLMTQKKYIKIKAENYPPDRLEKLQTLGQLIIDKKEQWQQQWDNNLQLVIQFYEEYGRWPKQIESYQGVNIGDWYIKQRHAAKSPFYPPERRLKLESAGVIGADNLQKAQEWEEKFQALQSFIETYKRLPKSGESHMGVSIGYWCATQRQNAYTLPNYPEEYRQRLLSLGVGIRKTTNIE